MHTQLTQAGAQVITREVDPAVLLEQVLAKTERNKKILLVSGALDQRVEKVRELLPAYMKGDAERLVKRAILTMGRIPKLTEATLDSFVRCVLEAAELGLAIDGKLGHAVPFNNKVKGTDGVERWQVECTFLVDYKGLIAVARRSGIIRDIHADVVCDNDHFLAERQGGTDLLIHKRDLKKPRGNVYAAYAIVTRPDGSWRYEIMDLEELHAVRARSKAYTRKGDASGPWVTDPKEMFKKTVIRRTLKMYAEDAALKRALDKDDDIDVDVEGPPATAFTPTAWPSAAPASAAAGPATTGNQVDDAELDGQDAGREPGEEG